MLYYDNLEEIIFNRHQTHQADELLVISGYVGPNPVSRLKTLPFPCNVVYGMYGIDGIQMQLHHSLMALQAGIDNVNIFYSKIPVHAKCYVWFNHKKIIHALIGSANFSTNGLTTPYREVLAETTVDTFNPLQEYLQRIIDNSISCLEGIAGNRKPEPIIVERTTSYCRMTLLDPDTNEVPNASGLNWGQNPNNHTKPNDAYIPIRTSYIRSYPELFPAKQESPLLDSQGGRIAHRHNDAIELIWDDGTNMMGLLEGTVKIDEIIYPKQISSFPEKSLLGKYIRNRLGVPDGARVNRQHLEKYGRTHIDVSLEEKGVYYFDFSVPCNH